MSKYVDMIPWEDCPHLNPPVYPKEKLEEFEASLAPHQREARRKGIPSIGSGAVYPVPDDSILCDPFEIPAHWGRAYGLDVGWRWTAAVFLAHDFDADIIYVTAEYYESSKPPVLHVHGIEGMMPFPLKGAIDPAAEQRGQVDGRRLMDEYKKLGLELVKANNAVEAGIHAVLTRMQSGQFKVFRTCTNWLKEKRLYRRRGDVDSGLAQENEALRGKIVKDRDHLMDATRYGVYTKGIFRQAPMLEEEEGSVRYGEF